MMAKSIRSGAWLGWVVAAGGALGGCADAGASIGAEAANHTEDAPRCGPTSHAFDHAYIDDASAYVMGTGTKFFVPGNGVSQHRFLAVDATGSVLQPKSRVFSSEPMWNCIRPVDPEAAFECPFHATGGNVECCRSGLDTEVAIDIDQTWGDDTQEVMVTIQPVEDGTSDCVAYELEVQNHF